MKCLGIQKSLHSIQSYFPFLLLGLFPRKTCDPKILPYRFVDGPRELIQCSFFPIPLFYVEQSSLYGFSHISSLRMHFYNDYFGKTILRIQNDQTRTTNLTCIPFPHSLCKFEVENVTLCAIDARGHLFSFQTNLLIQPHHRRLSRNTWHSIAQMQQSIPIEIKMYPLLVDQRDQPYEMYSFFMTSDMYFCSPHYVHLHSSRPIPIYYFSFFHKV